MAKKMNIGVQNLKGKINEKVVEIYPELEDLVIEPSLEEQKFKSEKYGYNEVTVKGVTAEIDEDIKSENIKEGVEILGVEGGYKGIDTSDATAIADDILENKTAYVNNEKVTGTIEKYDGSYEGNADGGIVITDARYLFYYGARIECLEELLASCKNITNAENMFYYCLNLTKLDVSKLDTSNVTNMKNMFYYCQKLTTLDLSNFNTSNVTDMQYMFYWMQSLNTLDVSNFDTSNVTNMSNIFYMCGLLRNLDLSSWDMNKITGIYNMFGQCTSLKNIKSFKNLVKGFTSKSNNYYTLNLKSCPLTYESAIDILTNGLYDLNLTYDVANGGTLYTQSIQFNANTLALLSEEDIAIAAAKRLDSKLRKEVNK